MQYKHGKNVKSLGYNHKPKFYSVIQYLFPHKKIKKNRDLLKPSAECLECLICLFSEH